MQATSSPSDLNCYSFVRNPSKGFTSCSKQVILSVYQTNHFKTMNFKTLATLTGALTVGTVIGVAMAPDQLVEAFVPGATTPTSLEVLCNDYADALETENFGKMGQVGFTMGFQYQIDSEPAIKSACSAF
jgi:hypothetical protein